MFSESVEQSNQQKAQRWIERWVRGQNAYLADPVRRREAAKLRQQTMARHKRARRMIRRLLEEKAVASWDEPRYVKVARELLLLKKQCEGAALASAARVLIRKYDWKGLSDDLLEAVCAKVLGFVPAGLDGP